MQLANHHAHTHFSDGKMGPEVYLKNAISQGLISYGFSDHAPIRIDNFGAMQLEELSTYLAKIDSLKEQYQGQIQIYKALEIDYIPGVIDHSTDYIQAANLDYTLGAIHFVEYLKNGRPWGFQRSHEQFQAGLDQIFGGDIQACVGTYYARIREMAGQTHRPTIVAHLDRIKKLNRGDRYFREQDTWYQEAVTDTLEAIAASGAIMEVNTKGYYSGEIETTDPGEWVLKIARELGIPVHLGSDAHHPDNITRAFGYGAEVLQKAGYQQVRILYDGIWQDFPLKQASVHAV